MPRRLGSCHLNMRLPECGCSSFKLNLSPIVHDVLQSSRNGWFNRLEIPHYDDLLEESFHSIFPKIIEILFFLVIHVASVCIEYPPNLALFVVIYQFQLIPTHMLCCEIHFLHDHVIWLNYSLTVLDKLTDKLLFSRIIFSKNRLSCPINLASLH